MTTTECEHVAEGWDDQRRGLFCGKCNVKLCTDCGSSPVWHYADRSYCRYCNDKNGYTSESRVQIDPDKLEARVGRELAEAILSECRSAY